VQETTSVAGVDYVVIVVYFFLILGFGTIFGVRTKTTKDFFLAGQRFPWWLIAMSCVATTVGSYSFIKYSEVAYKYGFSSTQTYLNDWFIMPIFMFGWLPIIYCSGVTSIPEYFARRFDTKTRIVATWVLIIYLVGYIGINFYTLGIAMHALAPKLGEFWWAAVIGVICAVYVTAGGQISVIMTDLVQGFLLLLAGLLLFGLGLHFVGGFSTFWHAIDPPMRHAFSDFNRPSDFSFVGIFWQDGMANTTMLYLINQGMILRFLSARNPNEGRKAMTVVVLVLMPVAAIVVSGAGWLGRAMVNLDFLSSETSAKNVFVAVASLLCGPGLFGFVIAALTAALMSTADTLINAVSSIVVTDIWRPYIVREKPDHYYLKVGRWGAVVASLVAILLVLVYKRFGSVYQAHAYFTGAITPPLVVAAVLGGFWPRYTPTAAFWTILGGSIAIAVSIALPELVAPFSHGVGPEGYKFMRALYGLAVCGVIGVMVTLFTEPKSRESIRGLVCLPGAGAK